jgi:hypothetical protein
MLKTERLLEYQAALEEIISHLEFIKNIVESRYKNIDNTKNFIGNICDRKFISIQTETCIYSKSLVKSDFKSQKEKILKIFLDSCETDQNEMQKFCKRFEPISLKKLENTSLIGNNFDFLLKRKFILQNSFQIEKSNLIESFGLFKEKFLFYVSKASVLLLEEEYLYKADDFKTISEEEKLFFEINYIIFLLSGLKNEISMTMGYQIFFNDLNILRFHSNFLKHLIEEFSKFPKLELDLKEKINNSKDDKILAIRNLDDVIKRKRYEKVKVLVDNIKKRDYYENWKNAKVEKVKKIQNFKINKMTDNKQDVLDNQDVENIVHPLMLKMYENKNKELIHLEKSWKIKLDEAVENMNSKLDDRRREAYKIHSKLVDLKKKYENYSEFVMKYKTEKIENVEREIKQIKVSNAAKIITNWWVNEKLIKSKRKKKKKVKNKL